MNRAKKQSGFTILELLLCVVGVGLLTVAVLPAWGDLIGDSSVASCEATVRAVQDALNARVSANKITGADPVVPENLDDVAVGGDIESVNCRTASGVTADVSNTCFYGVLDVNFTPPGWTKIGENLYQFTYVDGWKTYEYVPNEDEAYGTFECADSSDGSCS